MRLCRSPRRAPAISHPRLLQAHCRIGVARLDSRLGPIPDKRGHPRGKGTFRDVRLDPGLGKREQNTSSGV